MRKKLTDWLKRFDDEIHVAAFAFVIAANAASAAAARANDEPGPAVISLCITVAAILFHAWIIGQRMKLKWDSGHLAGRIEARGDVKRMEARHAVEAESTQAVTSAIDAAARRAVAAGQHAKVQTVIDSWRERQDAQLVEVLRELEHLTRPVGEA